MRPHRSVKDLVENILFLTGEPVSLKRFKESLPYDEEEISAALDSLQAEYQERGLKLRFVNGCWEMTSDPSLSVEVENFFNIQRTKRLSKAALETLAVIAYNQPITRPEIDTIRGVQTSGTIYKLQESNLIKVVGQKNSLGNPYLYGTTDEFLRHFGLGNIEELPPLEFEREGLRKPVLDQGEDEQQSADEPRITTVDFGLNDETTEITDHAQKKGA
ncbi:MAG TPA: SMC-Scp complex subunit ScpB [bacterium]|jgi:segregation and condensation protein B